MKLKTRGQMIFIDRRVAAHRARLSYLFLVLAFVILAEGSVSAEPPVENGVARKALPKSPQIAFVHLRFIGDQVQLIDFKVVPGEFKPAPEPAGERIFLQLVGSSGARLWEGWINDPRTRVLEHADPADGRLTAKVITVTNPEVTVRVPFVEAGQTLLVSRATAPKGSTARYQPLGSVQLRER